LAEDDIHHSEFRILLFSFLYRVFLAPLVRGVIAGASIGSAKGGRGRAGRKRWRDGLKELAKRKAGVPRVHLHAASVGEFEQAKPVIEALRERYRDIIITASFFSPSGYEQQGSYALLDAATYLPVDSRREMRAFLDAIDPDLILIIRYDLWPGLLLEAGRRKVPAVLLCGVLHAGSSRFNPLVRPFFTWLYGMLSLIHAVSGDDRASFAKLVPSVPVEVSGDTRYDRVVARARAAAELPLFDDRVRAGRAVLVAGSTWPPDEELIASVDDRDDLLIVLVPHEPTPEHVASLKRSFEGAVLLSELERDGVSAPPRAIIVDRTGILSALYRIGTIAYVGGGFGEGVHSVLEPAAYGIPVLCGPRIVRSRDAVGMAEARTLRVTRTREELADAIGFLMRDAEGRDATGRRAREYVETRAGATGRIMASLRQRGYLPS
jgi:3-deoxy-D-manno-octulosonic-acid transferase